jgi:hypothetical protein
VAQGIRFADVPVRAKAVLEFEAEPAAVMGWCRDVLAEPSLRVKRIEASEQLRLVAVTKASFFSFSERITIDCTSRSGGICSLTVVSVPRVTTTTVDGGTNFTNVVSIARFVRGRCGDGKIVSEKYFDDTTGKSVPGELRNHTGTGV